MKKLLFLLLFSFNYFVFYAQENTTTNDSISNINKVLEKDSFEVIENAPIYKGCSRFKTNQEKKLCMSAKITRHISKKFDINVAFNNYIPKGKYKILVAFKVNKVGDIIDIVAKSEYDVLANEADRVIRLIPKMKSPGFQRGKPVIVPYAIPIYVNVYKEKKKKKRGK